MTPTAEPITSSTLIYMIATRTNAASTLDLPIRFFESIDIMATIHLSPSLPLRCRAIDKLIANKNWSAIHEGQPLSWSAMHALLPALKASQELYPPHAAAEMFRGTMQTVALRIILLLAFREVRLRRVSDRFRKETRREGLVFADVRERWVSN